jgi:hypothetical protein
MQLDNSLFYITGRRLLAFGDEQARELHFFQHG